MKRLYPGIGERHALAWPAPLALLLISGIAIAPARSVGAQQPPKRPDTAGAVQTGVPREIAASRIRQASARLAAAEARRDVEAAVAFFSRDAIVHPPGAPAIVGREGVRKFYEQGFTLPFVSFTSTTSHVEVARGGDMAVETGVNRFVFGGPSGDITDVGKYLVLWRREGEEWRVAALSFSSDQAPPPAAPIPGANDAAAVQATVVDALRAAMARYAAHWTRSDVASLGSTFTPDAALYIAGAPAVVSRAAIEAAYRQSLAEDSVLSIATATTEAGSLGGGEAYSLGSYAEEIRRHRDGALRKEQGRFLAIWTRGADGEWRIRRFMIQRTPE